jgi:O-antigen/teichoic acid export membrane protein
LKRIDSFSKNIIIVFAGTSVVNFLNLLFQLFVAHRLSSADFAALNSLLAIFLLVSSPLATLQIAVAKYTAEYNAKRQLSKISFLLSDLSIKGLIFAVITFVVFWFGSSMLVLLLKIPSVACGYILAGLVAAAWLVPVLTGGVQGLELFGWLAVGSILSGLAQLIVAIVLIKSGYGLAGALWAILASSLINVAAFYFPLKGNLGVAHEKERISYKQLVTYLLPVAASNFFFITLVSFDMVLVKFYFSQADSGVYSLAQMIGKIFLFFPGAISLVMFPKVSGLSANNKDTVSTLKRSLIYAFGLCLLALFFYNLFPDFVLKVLTGKPYAESIYLGRLFGISMTFFSLIYILGSYFISIRDIRFLKYVALFTVLQITAIVLFHSTLRQVQSMICLNSGIIFLILLSLVNRKRAEAAI